MSCKRETYNHDRRLLQERIFCLHVKTNYLVIAERALLPSRRSRWVVCSSWHVLFPLPFFSHIFWMCTFRHIQETIFLLISHSFKFVDGTATHTKDLTYTVNKTKSPKQRPFKWFISIEFIPLTSAVEISWRPFHLNESTPWRLRCHVMLNRQNRRAFFSIFEVGSPKI